jgi:hypothetical protein
LANYWIIQSSAYEKEINIDKAELFKTAAIINIIVAIVSYFVPTLSFQGISLKVNSSFFQYIHWV